MKNELWTVIPGTYSVVIPGTQTGQKPNMERELKYNMRLEICNIWLLAPPIHIRCRYQNQWFWTRSGNVPIIRKYCENIPGNKYWPSGTIQERTDELLQPIGNRLSIITGVLSKHYPFRIHLNKIGLYNGDSRCRQCNKGAKTAHYVSCECEAFYPTGTRVQKNMTNNQLVLGTIMFKWVSWKKL